MKRSKPTIFIVTNFYFPTIGGISTYVSVLANELKRRGYGVEIRTYPLGMVRKEERIAGRMPYRLIHELMVALFNVYLIAGILALRLRGRRVIVHSQSASFCLGVGVNARILGASTIHTFHSPISRCSLRLMVLLHFAERLVCVSEEHRQMYSNYCGIPADVPIVPGGVNCDFYSIPSSEERARARAELVEQLAVEDRPGPIVLFVGRVVKEKGVDVLFDAANIVWRQIPDATFVVVGPTDSSAVQIEHIKDLKLRIKPGMRFYLTGMMDPNWLRETYRASDVMVCPSMWEEGSPMVIVEAMASGLPIVASSIGGLRSRVKNGVNGSLVRPGDSKELASAIIEIASSPAKMTSMGRESRQLAVAKFSDDAMTDEYERLYNELDDF